MSRRRRRQRDTGGEQLEERVLLVAEVEPNDSRATATAFVSSDSQLDGALSQSADDDYWRVSLQQGEVLTLRPGSYIPGIPGAGADGFTGDDKGELHFAPAVSVLDSSGTLQTASTNGRQLSYQAPAAGVYFVKVDSGSDFGAVTGQYSVLVETVTYSGSSEIEPNGTAASAQNVPVGGGSYGSEVAVASDLDLYRVSVSAGEAVVVSLRTSDDQLQARLLDDSLTEVATGERGFHSVPASSGDYFVEVSHRSGGTGRVPYLVNILTSAPSGNDQEAGHTLDSSTDFDLHEPGKVVGTLGSRSDRDVFRFSRNALDLVTFQLEEPAGAISQDRRLSILNEFGQLVSYSMTGELAPDVHAEAGLTGDMFLVVDTLSDQGRGGYAVSSHVGIFPVVRDVPIYFLDYTNETSHNGRDLAAGGAFDASLRDVTTGFFENTWSAYDVSVVTTAPASGTEYIGVGIGDYENGPGGFYHGYGVNRPRGDSVFDEDGDGWDSAADFFAESSFHEPGHATGSPHQRAVLHAMAYDSQADHLTYGQAFSFRFTDTRAPETRIRNERDAWDWNLASGRFVEETEPNNTLTNALSLDPPLAEMRADADSSNDRVIVTGGISSVLDVDVFNFEVTGGETWTFDIDAAEFQSTLDATILIRDADGNVIASNDNGLDLDSGLVSLDPFITHTFSDPGTYALSVSGASGSFGAYRLKVAPSLHDTTAPRVIATLPKGDESVSSNRQVRFWFNDQIDSTSIDASDVEVRGVVSGVQSGSVVYSPLDASLVWTANGDLPDDTYTVTLVSNGLTDTYGNHLDGETSGTLLWSEVSGNGSAGGDFVTRFTVSGSTQATPALFLTESRRHPANRSHTRLYFFSEELMSFDSYSPSVVLRGAGGDNVFGTTDDTFPAADVWFDTTTNAYARNTSGEYSWIDVFSRGILDDDDYRIEFSLRTDGGESFAGEVQVFGHNLEAVGDAVLVEDATLEVDVPASGRYRIQLGLNDPLSPKDSFGYDAEGLRRESRQLRYAGIQKDYIRDGLSVTDGKFTLRLFDTGGTDQYAAISTLRIESEDGSWSRKFDFGDDLSPVAPGFERLSQSTAYDATAGYGWITSNPVAAISAIEDMSAAGSWHGERSAVSKASVLQHGPSVVDTSFEHGEILASVDSVSIQFSGQLDLATLNSTSVMLRYSSDATFFDGDDFFASDSDGVAWDPTTYTATFAPEFTLPSGYYLLEVMGTGSDGVKDSAGRLLDGEFLNSRIRGNSERTIWSDGPSGDGLIGGDYRSFFGVSAGPQSLSLVATDGIVPEDGSESFTISRTGPTSFPLEVYLIGDGTNFDAVTSVLLPGGASSVTFDLTPIDNPDADGNRSVTLSVITEAPGFTGADVSVEVTDDEVAGFTVIESGAGTQLAESGTTDTLTVTLDARPLSGVVLAVSAGDITEVSALPAFVTFLPSNWNAPQTVTLTGVDDDLADGDVLSSLSFSVVDSASADAFDNVADQSVSVTTTDDDVAGFSVTESGGESEVDESGTTDSFTVVLGAGPLTDVVLSVTSGDIGESTAAPGLLTFTPSNWATAQTIVVTGVDDIAVDGDQSSDVVIKVVDGESDDAFDDLSDQSVVVTTTDDEVAGFTVTESGGESGVDESGTTDSFTVVLDAQPLSDVVLSVTSADVGEVSVLPSLVTFTPSNWNSLQTVTITGVDDEIVDGDRSTAVVIKVLDADSHDGFDNVADQSVTVTTTDDDVAGFTVIESGAGSEVSESGTTDTFTLALSAGPLSDVVLSVTSGNVGEVSVSLALVTFTPSNWNTTQTVTLTGVDDPTVDGDQVTDIVIKVVDIQSDDAFDNVSDETVAVTNTDDDEAAFGVTETNGGTIVDETGTTDTFSVVLPVQPLSPVVFAIEAADTSEATAAPTKLTFTPSNWDTSQVVTVTGSDDPAVDGDQSTNVVIKVIDAESDDAFDGLDDQAVTVTTTDDDVAGFSVSESDGGSEVSESGTTDSFSVVLDAGPLSDVVLSVTSGDVGETTVAPGFLTFTPSNWATTQTIVVTGVDDPAVDGDQKSNVVIKVVDIESNDAFDDVADQTVVVTTTDNEIAGFTIAESGSGSEVDESGTTDTLTVVLDAQPLSDVVLSVSPAAVGEVSASPGLVTFTPSNWNSTQTVTLTGVDDDVVDGDQISDVVIKVVDEDSHDGFDNVADQSVTVTTTDDDVAGFTVIESGTGSEVSESGTTDTFTLALSAGPLSDVVLSVTSGNVGEVSVSPALVTFTPSNWNTTQTVTLTGVDDPTVDGDQVTDIVIKVVDDDSHDAFDNVSDETVVVTNTDDEIAGLVVAESEGKTIVQEGGASDTVGLSLSAEPLGPVVVKIQSEDDAEVIVDSQRFTYTPANWSEPQSIFVTAVDDAVRDGKRSTNIRFSVVPEDSADGFDATPDQLVSAVTIDNDSPVYLGDTVLIIEGTPEDDVLSIREDTGSVFVTLNSEDFSFGTDEYEKIKVSVYTGNDIVDAAAVSTPLIAKLAAGADEFTGGAGDDTVRGGSGRDRVLGKQGSDLLSTGSGVDHVEGGLGDDRIRAGNGADSVWGNEGSDTVSGGGGLDSILGGAGPDQLGGGSKADTVDGEDGDDTLFGGPGPDHLRGGSGNDLADGENSDDQVEGGPGRDVLLGGTGRDTLDGGDGDDILVASTTTLSRTELGSIVAEWASGRTYAQRVANVRGDSSRTEDRLNTAFLVGSDRSEPQTVFDDSNKDTLTGRGQQDLFFATLAQDLDDHATDEWFESL